jgi:hypothetical protein
VRPNERTGRGCAGEGTRIVEGSRAA